MVSFDARYLAPGKQQRLSYFQAGIHQLFLGVLMRNRPFLPSIRKRQAAAASESRCEAAAFAVYLKNDATKS